MAEFIDIVGTHLVDDQENDQLGLCWRFRHRCAWRLLGLR
jgi:hypothetical protein